MHIVKTNNINKGNLITSIISFVLMISIISLKNIVHWIAYLSIIMLLIIFFSLKKEKNYERANKIIRLRDLYGAFFIDFISIVIILCIVRLINDISCLNLAYPSIFLIMFFLLMKNVAYDSIGYKIIGISCIANTLSKKIKILVSNIFTYSYIWLIIFMDKVQEIIDTNIFENIAIIVFLLLMLNYSVVFFSYEHTSLIEKLLKIKRVVIAKERSEVSTNMEEN